MAGIKSLLKDTAIYGVSSIVGRFLNWCLVPLYTVMFAAAEYGVVTYIYSIVALALIILTYGMETGFFRFSNHDDYSDATLVYSTSLISLATTSTLFLALVLLFLRPIAGALECAAHPEYIAMMAAAVAADAFTAIPFSYLRRMRRPMRFASLKLVGIGLNIGLNLFWILLCPKVYAVAPSLVGWCYTPGFGIGYIFLANLVSSLAMLILLIPELRGFRWRFDAVLWRRMLVYSWPLLVLGVAGIMNQTIDKILYPLLVADKAEAMTGLGIYGANYKVAIVMVMFIQAFRFAYEPFIFARNKEAGDDRMQSYRDAMRYFVVFAMILFLAVMYYIDILKYFISPRYFSGLKVVPLIMIAEFFFGVFFNLSLWYKLTDKTIWGMWFSLLGLVVTVVLNVVLVPHMGYMGCAVAALCCYAVMMVVSWIIGHKKFPIGYNVRRLAGVFLTAMLFWGIAVAVTTDIRWLDLTVRTALLATFVAVAMRIEHISLHNLIPSRS